MFNNVFPENRAMCEITWQNMVEQENLQMAIQIRRMRFECWITRATDTLRICIGYCLSTTRVVTRTPPYYVICALPLLLVISH